jgi:hypothetical protein
MGVAVRARVLMLSLGATVACSPELPARVVVPGDGYAESIEVSTGQGDSARVAVGAPLLLHAVRRSGPWVEVDRTSLPPDGCWWRSAPDAVEGEAAGSLRWFAEPAGDAEFGGFRTDFARDVRFSAPGRYLLWAESGGWCSEPYSGDTLVVDVSAR